MRPTIRALVSVICLACVPRVLLAQATGNGNGAKTGDGTTPFTALAQAPEAQLFLGAATTSVPIQLPPNRNNFTPQLALTYNSNTGPSPYGHGWDLALPRLQRTGKRGVLSCSDDLGRQELVLTLSDTTIECTLDANGRCLPHVESGFIRIQRDDVNDPAGTTFKVRDKNGTIYTFGGPGEVTTSFGTSFSANGGKAVVGSSTTAAFTAGSPCAYVSTWALSKVEDSNGNYIEYRYVRDGDVLYPHSIVYGANYDGGLSHRYTVQFLWQTRSDAPQPAPGQADDVSFSAIGGYPAYTSYRLQRIEVRYDSALARAYQFTYDQGPNENGRKGRQTFLESVTLYGDHDQALAGSSTMFLYHENKGYAEVDGAGFETDGQTANRPTTPALLAPSRSLRAIEDSGTRRDVIDMNGDGFPDLVDAAIGVQCKPDGPTYRYWNVYFGSKTGFSTTAVRWYMEPNTATLPACIIQGVLNGEDTLHHTRFMTVDMTGDGLPDLVDSANISVGGLEQWTVYPGTSASPFSPGGTGWGFGAGIAWTFAPGEGVERSYVRKLAPDEPINFAGYDGDASVVYQDLFDINGDGLPDLVRTCGTSCTFSTNWEVYLNRGDGTGFQPREYFPGKYNAITVTTSPDPSGTLYTVLDINGDGLVDQVSGKWRDANLPAVYTVCLNSGHSMQDDCSDWPVAPRGNGTVIHENFNGPLNTMRDLVDMNGDGLPDVVDREGWTTSHRYWRVFLNRGFGFEADPILWSAPHSLVRDGGENGELTTKDTLDLDGDGMVDFVSYYDTSFGQNATKYRIFHAAYGATDGVGSNVAKRKTGVRPDLLEIVENGIGSKTTLQYRPSTDWMNDAGDGISDLPFNLWTLTQVCHDDGLASGGTCDAPVAGHQVGMNLTYEAGRYDPVEREFRGFGGVMTTATGSGSGPRRGTYTIYHQTSALAGKVQQTFAYDASGGGTYLTQRIASTDNTWQCARVDSESSQNGATIPCPAHPGEPGDATPAGRIWTRLRQVDENSYTDFGSPVMTTRTLVDSWHKCTGAGFGTYGAYFGNVEDSTRGATSAGTGPQLHTHTLYACPTDPARYVAGRPVYQTLLTTSMGTVLEEKWFHYDGTYGSVTKGNLTRIESWIDQGDPGLASNCSQRTSSRCASTTFTYDLGHGGVLTRVTDPNGSYVDTGYDTVANEYLYPNLITNSLNHHTALVYNRKCGTLEQQSIPYVGTTQPTVNDWWRNTYDHYCRLETVYRPGENTAALPPYQQFSYYLATSGTPVATVVSSREPTHAGGVRQSSVISDGLGRVIQRKGESVIDGTQKVVMTTSAYDDAGNLRTQTAPEALSSATFNQYTTPTSGIGATTMLYDAAGRLTRVTHPDLKYQTIDVSDAWQTTTQDECYNASGCTGLKIVEVRDALGHTTQRTETDENGTLMSATRYQADELGRVTQTTQGVAQGGGVSWNANTTVTTVYDSLGRTIRITDPDTGTSAAGVRRYGYDPGGNIRYDDDPTAGRHMQFCYDALNRVTKKKYVRSGDFGTLMDCATNQSEQVTYSYDAATNGLGRLSQVTDLSGISRIYSYTTVGEPLSIEREMDGVSAPAQYTYDTVGHLTQLKYPDDELIVHVLDEVGRTKAVAQISQNPVYVQNLTYDIFGRPRTIAHGNGRTDTRTYETSSTLNYRLTQITGAAGAGNAFTYNYTTYDAAGRLKAITDSAPTPRNNGATYTYDGLGRLLTADLTAAGNPDSSFGYNALGNITSKDQATCTYSGTKPHQMGSCSGTPIAGFQYDANGNRKQRIAGVAPPVLDYLYDMDDRLRLIDDHSGQGVEFTYDFAGRRTKEIRGTLVSDPVLGFKVDPTGAVVTYHFTDNYEVTHDPAAMDPFVARKYYFASGLLVASQETTNVPARLQVAAAGSLGGVRVAGLFGADGPVLVMRIGRQAAVSMAQVAIAGSVLLFIVLPARRRPVVVGVRVRPIEAAVLAAVVVLGSLPWPVLIRPAFAGGGPGATPTPVPGGLIHHYHLDHLGSPQAITDGAGNQVKSARLFPYGTVRYDSSGAFSDWDDREFTGYERDPLSGHDYAGARFYDSDFAVFLSHDPARQFANPYTYTNWNPIGRTDPTGAYVYTSLDTLAEIGAVASASSSQTVATSTATASETNTGAVGSASSEASPSVASATINPNYSVVLAIRLTVTPGGAVLTDSELAALSGGNGLAGAPGDGTSAELGAQEGFTSPRDLVTTAAISAVPWAAVVRPIAIPLRALAGRAMGGVAERVGLKAIAEGAGDVAGRGIPRVTEKGLARIEGHLDDVLRNQFPELSRVDQLRFQAGERAMLERLRAGATTSQDIEFYLHELKESARFR